MRKTNEGGRRTTEAADNTQSALGSVPTGALSSAQAMRHATSRRPPRQHVDAGRTQSGGFPCPRGSGFGKKALNPRGSSAAKSLVLSSYLTFDDLINSHHSAVRRTWLQCLER